MGVDVWSLHLRVARAGGGGGGRASPRRRGGTCATACLPSCMLLDPIVWDSARLGQAKGD
eukprot:363340-Chlamydomonas_euryale.AAC.10